MKHNFINFIKGMFIGIANIIPGVSGGTIAVILNVFDQIINVINNFSKDIKKNLNFILPLGLGIVFSILVFSSFLEFCLNNYSLPTNLFFVGLVCGSIPIIYKKSILNGTKSYYILLTLMSVAIVILISMMKNNNISNINEEIEILFLAKIFLGGFLAAAAMIIPGISGSFVMILLGIYPHVIHTISNISKCFLNISDKNLLISTGVTVAALGFGIILGILFISKVISFLMDKFYGATYSAILGLVIGSVYGIFSTPITYQSGVNSFTIMVSAVTFTIGAIISYFLGEKN